MIFHGLKSFSQYIICGCRRLDFVSIVTNNRVYVIKFQFFNNILKTCLTQMNSFTILYCFQIMILKITYVAKGFM